MDEVEVTGSLHILMQMTEYRLMPFEGFRTMPDAAMGLEILLDRSFHCQTLAFLSGGSWLRRSG
jgi:hypothetical protein